MIEILPESTDKILAVKATEKLTDADYKEVWIPALEKLIHEFGKINVVLHLDDDFQGWEAKALWDDALFGVKHRKNFSRIAVVGGAKWMDWATKIGELLMEECAIKMFAMEDAQKAFDWVRGYGVAAHR